MQGAVAVGVHPTTQEHRPFRHRVDEAGEDVCAERIRRRQCGEAIVGLAEPAAEKACVVDDGVEGAERVDVCC